MGDSFFGFNTSLLNEEALHQLAQKQRAAREDADVYDFQSLRDELGDEDEINDGLGDQLEEVGDDLNDETFGADDIGQDFDFAANTVKFTANLPEEERGHRYRSNEGTNERQGGQRWTGRQEPPPTDHRNGGHPGSYDEASMNTKSIWGNFGNNDSFGAMNQGNVSPFGRHQQLGYAGISPSSSMGLQQQQQQQQRQHRSLEEIEAEMQRVAKQRQGYGGDEYASGGGGKKVLSLAEVEAAMMQRPMIQQQQRQQQLQQQHLLHLQEVGGGLPSFNGGNGGFGQPDPAQLMALHQQHELMEQMSIERELKRRETMRKSQYDNLMTQHDKDLVQRIQLTQLASGDPYADDFYYQVYSSLRMRAAGGGNKPTASTTNESRGGRSGRREDNMVQRMQQQVQRIVNDAKRRPKQTQGKYPHCVITPPLIHPPFFFQVTLEGALGKISSLSTRNPRQILQVSDKKSANHHDDSDHSKTEADHHDTTVS
ncbi:hypothetical protein [Absidia glauca]|uniref:mRNA decay factor PAT1 domain-containing protein n=1 Tax=Absidia glauca TaxID=4829 RepID=A0A168PQV7_ABSGL|nr:hypothetical protein [Absidia glauca]